MTLSYASDNLRLTYIYREKICESLLISKNDVLKTKQYCKTQVSGKLTPPVMKSVTFCCGVPELEFLLEKAVTATFFSFNINYFYEKKCFIGA